MISNFKLIPNFNISQNFVQNVQKQKNTFVLSWNGLLKFYGRPKIKRVGTFFAAYKNLNMQCNFNMHNIHILLFLFKPNFKGFIKDTNFIPFYVENNTANNLSSIYDVLIIGSYVNFNRHSDQEIDDEADF